MLLALGCFCFLLPCVTARSYENRSAHLPEGCPTFESWRLSKRCAYVYESKDCSGYSVVLNLNDTYKPGANQSNTIGFVLIRPGCEVGISSGHGYWGLGGPFYQFPDGPIQYDSAECTCQTDDLKLLTCVPRRKLAQAGSCSHSATPSSTTCTYNVQSGVYKIGEKTRIGGYIQDIVMSRVAFYDFFNGTDIVTPVNAIAEYAGTATGLETLGGDAGTRSDFTVWQVTYVCGSYQVYLARTLLTIEEGVSNATDVFLFGNFLGVAYKPN